MAEGPRAGCGEAPAGGRPGGRGAAGGWDGVKSGFIFPMHRTRAAATLPVQDIAELCVASMHWQVK